MFLKPWGAIICYWRMVVPSTATYYREQADECRKQAAFATDSDNREAWLKMAAEWLQTADAAEGKARR